MSQSEQKTQKKCISCGINIVGTGYTHFPCPDCGYDIHRCKKCRKQSNLYKCPDCGFIGP